MLRGRHDYVAVGIVECEAKAARAGGAISWLAEYLDGDLLRGRQVETAEAGGVAGSGKTPDHNADDILLFGNAGLLRAQHGSGWRRGEIDHFHGLPSVIRTASCVKALVPHALVGIFVAHRDASSTAFAAAGGVDHSSASDAASFQTPAILQVGSIFVEQQESEQEEHRKQ